MRAIVLLVLVLAIGLTCPIQSQSDYGDVKLYTVEPSGYEETTSAADMVREMIGRVDRDRAVQDLRRLVGEQPICTSHGCYSIANRSTGSQGLQ